LLSFSIKTPAPALRFRNPRATSLGFRARRQSAVEAAAEIYPSVRTALTDEIKDRGQVRTMWQWACDLDRDNLLWREFCRPIDVETGSKEDLAIQLIEGWILGCSPTVTNQ
jgi:hypothetical protein